MLVKRSSVAVNSCGSVCTCTANCSASCGLLRLLTSKSVSTPRGSAAASDANKAMASGWLIVAAVSASSAATSRLKPFRISGAAAGFWRITSPSVVGVIPPSVSRYAAKFWLPALLAKVVSSILIPPSDGNGLVRISAARPTRVMSGMASNSGWLSITCETCSGVRAGGGGLSNSAPAAAKLLMTSSARVGTSANGLIPCSIKARSNESVMPAGTTKSGMLPTAAILSGSLTRTLITPCATFRFHWSGRRRLTKSRVWPSASSRSSCSTSARMSPRQIMNDPEAIVKLTSLSLTVVCGISSGLCSKMP